MSRPALAYLSLAVAALLFGATFVVVKEAVTILPPYAFVGWRFLIGAFVLFLLARPRSSRIWIDGMVAGLFLFGGYAFQTVGLAETSASNSGLITGLYVVFTPLAAAAFHRRRPRVATIAGTLLAFGGLALLTIGDGVSLQRGDLLTVGCAVMFAGHIVALSRLAPRHPVVPFTAVQLLVTAVASLALSGTEGFPLPTTTVIPALAMTGVLVSAGAFLTQVWAQTVVGPNRTAIMLSLEPAFAAGVAALVLGERLTSRGWIGAGLILVAIYVVLWSTGDEDLPAAEAVSAAH